MLNEAEIIEPSLNRLQTYRKPGMEVILVDGGSSDNTCQLARPLVDKLIISEPGRAIQMNKGAAQASGGLLLFLHIDTVLSDTCLNKLAQLNGNQQLWGRFDVKLSNPKAIYKIIAYCINLRSRITHIATGDQCIFVSNDLFNEINGYPAIALMEDIAISKKLRKIQKPMCLKETVITSSRRWEQNGVIKTILLMWFLRLAYFFKISPARLNTLYEK